MESGLTLAATAYQRWMVRCMAAAGMAQLSPLEVLILHTVHHRGRPKRFADIALVLDVEEQHLVTYAVRKLEQAGLVSTQRTGKEKVVSATEVGSGLCERYAAVREQLLVNALRSAGAAEAKLWETKLSETGALLRTLSGTYNQAARAAATM